MPSVPRMVVPRLAGRLVRWVWRLSRNVAGLGTAAVVAGKQKKEYGELLRPSSRGR
jgi:hypothetical protein